ncbi:hypothetical protein [Salinibacter ruber]|jgi:hypothetical protein|uniref:hypothetical protein n=1 Tax=Salinibacter ruber TaxID=146919 RepID=UPI002168845A|nr:hypothetical protein [Salinibacter ruber]MCS3649195.1 hypothetical protein [Salinibacter ruber]
MKSRLLLSLLVIAFLTGCSGGQVATVSYDSGSNRSVYETKRYEVSSLSGSGYGSTGAMRMRVVAQCTGVSCTPNVAQLVFGIDGSERLSLSDVSGRIIADETVVRWSSTEANRGFAGTREGEVVEVLGEFATVEIDVDQLQAMATATSLEGSLGGQSLNLDADVQFGLQTLLQKMRQSRSDGNSSNTGA